MESTTLIAGLNVPDVLRDLVEEMAKDSGFDARHVWKTLRLLCRDFMRKNETLLAKRGRLQREIDAWLSERRGIPFNRGAFGRFLSEIGYLKRSSGHVKVHTQNLDPELGIPGPQLVNPIDSARFALNAANARHPSLWDALYGSPDIIPMEDGREIPASGYNQVRGAAVIAYVNGLLSQLWPLSSGSHAQVVRYYVSGDEEKRLIAVLESGTEVNLANPEQFVGYCGAPETPERIILVHHGLHLQFLFSRGDGITVDHKAGVQDVLLEAALTSIQDLEDATAAIGAEAKAVCYRNLFGLMKGDLTTTFSRTAGGNEIPRALAPDIEFITPTNGQGVLKGRALLLVRNVGMHKYTDVVTLRNGRPIPERLLDLVMTVLASLHDLKKTGGLRNTTRGSIYIVQPKLHGPEEVMHIVRSFRAVAEAFDLPSDTIKLGLMDEEMRTSVNLEACIAEAAEVLFFINTGFLDRTGDMMHTFMQFGPLARTGDMKEALWMLAYEENNVAVGLAAGLHTVGGQIGKGMHAKPNAMAEMLVQKIAHPRAGASTAWVPSPKAAVLHSLHYHRVDVRAVQAGLAVAKKPNAARILEPALLAGPLTAEEIEHELKTLIQGILGYVSRWVMMGIGCSRVPNLEGVDLMEDLATLRIKAQLLANWLHHAVISESQLRAVFEEMAAVVDEQNSGQVGYNNMAGNFETNPAYRAALELVFRGKMLPRGYVTYVLDKWREHVLAT